MYNMNTREATQITTYDSAWSFEECLLSRYEVCHPERRLLCALCKKMTSTTYKLQDQSIDCHGQCLMLALFHFFMNHYESFVQTNYGFTNGVNPLTRICEMPLKLLTMAEYNNRCVFCGARGAFFKCAADNCVNHYHMNCNSNGMVIINRQHAGMQTPHYRFMLCQTHMNPAEAEHVAYRFKKKVSRIFNHEDLIAAMPSGPIKRPLSSDSITPLSSVSSISDTPRPCSRGKGYQKQTKSDRKQTITRGSAARKIEDYLLPTSALKSGRDAKSTPLRDRGVSKDGVAALLNEYGLMRRYGSHRNTKRFEWHPYSVLFTKVTPEWFSAEINPYMETTELCKDLRSVLVFDKCAETASDLSRLTLECEPCLMNISNSMALQLKQQSITMRLSGKVDAEASEIGPTRDTSNRDNGAHNSHRLSNPLTPIIEHMNMLPPRYDINIRNALMDKFQMVGYRTHRPIFVLARFGNKAAWFSIAYLRSKKYGYTKRIVLDYINLGILEYEYLQRVIRSCYYLPMQTKVIPIIAKPAERNEQEVNGDVDKVTLGGFCWDVEPTVEGYLTNRLVTPLKLSDDTSQANTHPFGGSLINVEDVEANMLYKEDATTRTTNFVSKQANILVGILRTVNNAIEEHKKLIMEKVAAEHAYRNRVHENALMTDQYSKLAFQMNRWSHFRQSLMQSLDMFNSILAYETQADSETSQSIKAKAEATNDISEKEFCSVCLLSEPAHKLLMHQCNRCFIRVHYKCYVVYKTLVGDQVNLDVKPEGTTNEWYCDPCEYEILMNANSKSALCNNAVCCVCYSSGGALKRVSEVAGKRQQSMLPIKWIHLHCVALLMPRVICHDWAALNKWELRNVKFTTGEKCMICLVNGGIMLHCAERDCHVKFHTTCAWIGGAYVTESPFHNSTEIEGGRKMFTPNAELFPTLALRVYCIKHTVERFSENAVKALMKRRCFAYTHYLYCPWYDNKETPDTKTIQLPLKPCHGYVEITRKGAIRAMPLEVARRKEEIEAIAEQVVYDKRAKQRKSSSKAAQSSMSNHIQSSMMTQQYPGMMMNYSAGMMVNGPTMMNSPMLMNHGHSMMMNSVPQVMMNAHHPGMINMRHSMAPNIMRKPLVPHLVYGTQGPYMMEQAPYGVSAPASHMSANAYPQQMTQQRMSAMKMTMQPTMMPYMQPMNMMQMMPMVQQPQYQHPGYGQPMQVVPQYWSQRGNGMQYKDQQSCTDEQYIGVGNMGYMEQ